MEYFGLLLVLAAGFCISGGLAKGQTLRQLEDFKGRRLVGLGDWDGDHWHVFLSL
jgi:hypothetical protein